MSSAVRFEQVDDDGWIRFRSALEQALGVPLTAYKEPQLRRRLGSLAHRLGLESWSEFAARLTDAEVLDRIRDTLTINVSEFFRQPERFLELRDRFLPQLLAVRPHLRIWSAGCSVGCEPYTIAMILHALTPGRRHFLLATDVDFAALARARSGRGYLPHEVRSVPDEYRQYLIPEPDGTWSVREDVRELVTFRHHDLLKDPYPADLDLIVCRNVVIYFTEEAKQRVYEGFARALRPGGLIFVGGSELILHPRAFGFTPQSIGIYGRAA